MPTDSKMVQRISFTEDRLQTGQSPLKNATRRPTKVLPRAGNAVSATATTPISVIAKSVPELVPNAAQTLEPERYVTAIGRVANAHDEQTQLGTVYTSRGTLSSSEEKILALQEKRIESGKSAFIAVAEALLIIRDRRLYRQTHGTFDAYCRERWEFARNYANKLISSCESLKLLPPELGTTVPNEAVAREIAKVEPERRVAVVREAADRAKANGRSVVARDIYEARKSTHKNPEQKRNRQNLTMLKKWWTASDPDDRSIFLHWVRETDAQIVVAGEPKAVAQEPSTGG